MPSAPEDIGAPVAADSVQRRDHPPAPRHPLGRAVTERLPLELRAALVTPHRPAIAGLIIIVVLALLLGVGFWHMSRPVTRAAPAVERTAPRATTPHEHANPSAAPTTAGTVTVHVVGAVRRPGIVRLAGGSRVADAVTEAGGPTAKAAVASVNLARLLIDGEQVVVLTRREAATAIGPVVAATAPAPGDSSTAAVLDLNTATVEQLDGLPGVGPVLARRIIEWRSRNGRFTAVSELREVTGIGDAKYAELEQRVRV